MTLSAFFTIQIQAEHKVSHNVVLALRACSLSSSLTDSGLSLVLISGKALQICRHKSFLRMGAERVYQSSSKSLLLSIHPVVLTITETAIGLFAAQHVP